MPGTARKSTDAKNATPKNAAPKTGFDFGSLTATDAPLPGRDSKQTLASTPFVAWIKESWDGRKDVQVMRGSGKARKSVTVQHGVSKATTVPADMVESVTRLLREAANVIGCGLAIRPSDEDENGNVTVAFRAQTKSKGQGRPLGSTNKPKPKS